MKISELTNAPQWLLDADTRDADVEIKDGIVIWHGGDWLGGDWWGGVWLGGDWHGGVWRGGDWWGEKLTHNLWTVFGLKWPVTISPTRMQIGCELHTFAQWESFDDATINKMETGALKFWRTHKPALMALCESAKRDPL